MTAFKLVGVISAESDPPGLDRARYIELIDAEELLVGAQDGPADEALVELSGATIGRLSWSKTANEIDVYSRAAAPEVAQSEVAEVAQIAWRVARVLGGRYVTLEEMMRC